MDISLRIFVLKLKKFFYLNAFIFDVPLGQKSLFSTGKVSKDYALIRPYVRFKVFTEMKICIIIIWIMKSCSLVCMY
jgi:hypothetical protein